MPKRIQRKRTKGWRMPENTVYVGRPSVWGNPFPEGWLGDRAVPLYRDLMQGFFNGPGLRDLTDSQFQKVYRAVQPFMSINSPNPKWLRGKNLACWCKESDPCHADVLLELANA